MTVSRKQELKCPCCGNIGYENNGFGAVELDIIEDDILIDKFCCDECSCIFSVVYEIEFWTYEMDEEVDES